MKVDILGKEITIDESILEVSEDKVRKQLAEYRKDERRVFDLEMSFPDNFTGEVMREHIEIPYGETKTYGEIAKSLNTSAIAVGQACGRNPVPIIVPCHRLVGKSSLGGYSEGLDLKKKLLKLEGADF